MSEIPTIGDVVREWRQYLQISLTEFSQKTKLSKGYISELEHNKIANPKKDKLKQLSAALGLTEMDIVSRRMPPKDGGAVPTTSSKQGLAGQGNQQVSANEDEDVETEDVQEIKQVQVNKGQEPGGGQQLRRRRGGALASPPIDQSSLESDSVEARTVGQEIDDVLEELSHEGRDRQREILVSIARQLVRLERLHMGGEQ
jgi:transcriptional regulator with XRE-family HTH domain